MRSNLPGTGYIHICDSEKGGGQGNALTGYIYVINQDPALKATEAAYPGVEVRAIQDDITLIGDPLHVWGDDDALAYYKPPQRS